ncbi:piggyBac transposable element-derived protein 5 isoform X1 [Polyodon spathula]|uniref:piggyBac transposable element-derived protein 5 isoform X1 n=1 Tax=Polyodon spathula TaxID=7913 RepID=UPI001B7E69DB|nr:piggyBac transposable element-derived protein 5 isoform X1 [Polyodon spathula]
MAECGRKALSVMEAVRSRYESLQISDDVLGESGDDSSENPFYSTSGGSSSENYTSESNGDEQRSAEMSGNQSGHPPGSVSNIQAEEESWTDALREITVPAFKDTCGPAQKMPANASTIDFFQFFVPDNVIQNMVTQTNMYAKKFQERFGSDEGWCNVTLSEMKAFLGYVTSTSIHRCDSVLSIWTNGFYSNKSIALIMTQSRFEKILKYFHIVAFRSSQTSNGLYKIQPFLDSLQQSLECSFRPSQTQVLHEPLIDEDPVFITTCTERELRKRKKRKFSLWVRQCTASGFICQVYVHLKEGAGSDNLGTLKNKPQLHSLVARQLCQNLSGKNSIIFTGPSITSLNLFEEFEKQDIYCCGLLSSRKSDCTGLPQSMLTNPDAPQRRGQYTTKMKGNMSLICWHNKGHFRFLTNAYSPSKQGVIIKRKRGEVPCPLAVEAFAAHLSYICKYDDKYSKYFISHKPNKTWQQVFWLTISIVINNAYILYKMSDAYHMKRYSRAQFGERLVRELLGLEDCSPTH